MVLSLHLAHHRQRPSPGSVRLSTYQHIYFFMASFLALMVCFHSSLHHHVSLSPVDLIPVGIPSSFFAALAGSGRASELMIRMTCAISARASWPPYFLSEMETHPHSSFEMETHPPQCSSENPACQKDLQFMLMWLFHWAFTIR